MQETEQISFFDIELPPANISKYPKIKETEVSKKEETQTQTEKKFSMARVPDDEYSKRIYGDLKLPTVDSIIKKIHQDSYSIGIHELLSDVFECGAIAISNQFHMNKAREEQYKRTMSKHDEKTRRRIMDIFNDIYLLLTSQTFIGFNDYLGELYMKSETSNKHTGQFFTPYCLSKCCAEMSIGGNDVERFIEEDEILTLNEPTCGAGGMIIAAVDVLYNKYHFNYSRNLLVECSDIDSRCVHMTYLQLALSGIPAIIYHRNTLTMETWDRWETPAYIMQYLRFKNTLR